MEIIEKIKHLNELVEHRAQLIHCRTKLEAGIIRCIDVMILPSTHNPDDHIYLPTVLNSKIKAVIIRMLNSAQMEIEREIKI